MERMRQLESALDAARRHAAKAAALEQANQTLCDKPEDGAAGGGGGGAAEQEVIDLMEVQLLRLSDIVRAKEEELAAMRLTIQVCGGGGAQRCVWFRCWWTLDRRELVKQPAPKVVVQQPAVFQHHLSSVNIQALQWCGWWW
jgi:hypothetical protein